MNTSFKRVILYARQHRAHQGVNESLHRLVEFLTSKKIAIFQDKETHASFKLNVAVLERQHIKTTDLIVVVGGDGSLLSAARMATEVGAPVIGINRGHLGFLTDIMPHDIERLLAPVLAGNYEEEHRFLLHTTIHHQNQIDFEGNALNDVVLSRGNETHLIEFDVYIDQLFVSHFRSDGIILSTPTGSTAYALSAGGPIMHPQLNAMVLVPMFSHSLSSRPLVVSGEAQIDLQINISNEHALRISCDGHESHLVKTGQTVSIKKNQHQLRLLHPSDYHYYDTLRSKLGWESKHQG